jgi:hypothetical protein
MLLTSNCISQNLIKAKDTLTSCVPRDFVKIEDTLSKFEISIPKSWGYFVPDNYVPNYYLNKDNKNYNRINGIPMVAFRKPLNKDDWKRESLMIEILQKDYTDIEKSLQEEKIYWKGIMVHRYEITSEENKLINGRVYKYLIKKYHGDNKKGNETIDFVLLTNNNGIVLILTFTTYASINDCSKLIFEKIIDSLIL